MRPAEIPDYHSVPFFDGPETPGDSPGTIGGSLVYVKRSYFSTMGDSHDVLLSSKRRKTPSKTVHVESAEMGSVGEEEISLVHETLSPEDFTWNIITAILTVKALDPNNNPRGQFEFLS